MRISDWSSDVCSSDLEGLRSVAVLNGADAQGADNEAALEMIGDIEGIEVLPTSIVRRKAFPNAAAEGRAVGEQSPRDAKAIDELGALVSAVRSAEHTSELQSLMQLTYTVFRVKQENTTHSNHI